MELSQEPPQDVSLPADDHVALRAHIIDKLLATRPSSLAEGEQIDQACRDQGEAVLQLLIDLGHVIPGAPPASRILADAKSFAERLTLSQLALRIYSMLAWANVETPESKPARKFIEDYIDGKNHGPAGYPMLWPGKLPGLASMLRAWGFVPTIATPGAPSYVARAVPSQTVQ
jgi:hypothetical protein